MAGRKAEAPPEVAVLIDNIITIVNFRTSPHQ
jgi:hypothetical protein